MCTMILFLILWFQISSERKTLFLQRRIAAPSTVRCSAVFVRTIGSAATATARAKKSARKKKKDRRQDGERFLDAADADDEEKRTENGKIRNSAARCSGQLFGANGGGKEMKNSEERNFGSETKSRFEIWSADGSTGFDGKWKFHLSFSISISAIRWQKLDIFCNLDKSDFFDESCWAIINPDWLICSKHLELLNFFPDETIYISKCFDCPPPSFPRHDNRDLANAIVILLSNSN